MKILDIIESKMEEQKEEVDSVDVSNDKFLSGYKAGWINAMDFMIKYIEK